MTRVRLILDGLAEQYPQAGTSLHFANPFQLFVATVLSAQTTDEQVNRITAALFKAVPTVQDLAAMEPGELEPYLKSCGLYRHKSRYLVEAARIIVKDFGGSIPEEFDQLIKLPGVGRKTANIIVSAAFGRPALAVDTHVFRVSRRLGLADGKTVEAVEEQLKTSVPSREWVLLHHRLIAHGRSLCTARSPQCRGCFLVCLCPSGQERGEKYDLEKT